MNYIIHMLVTAFAVWEIVEVWHHGHIFDGLRARAENLTNDFLRGLLACPFCLSLWVAFAATGTLLAIEPGDLGAKLIAWPIMSLASARLANAFNDLGYKHCRTPRDAWPSASDVINNNTAEDKSANVDNERPDDDDEPPSGYPFPG